MNLTDRDPGPVRLVVAISSRSLFDLGASHQVFEIEGVEAYCQYQIEHEEDVLELRIAFPIAKKLLALNRSLGERGQVELILLSRNSSDTGLTGSILPAPPLPGGAVLTAMSLP